MEEVESPCRGWPETILPISPNHVRNETSLKKAALVYHVWDVTSNVLVPEDGFLYVIERGCRCQEGLVKKGNQGRAWAATFFWKYTSVRFNPSWRSIFGSQPSKARARVMSGLRNFGSSWGSGL
jgi:hypothetical protein